MRQLKNLKIRFVVVLLIATGLLATPALADAEAEDLSLYRLDFRVTEFKNGDKTNTRTYTLLSRNDKGVQIRTGNRVPIPRSDGGLEYLSVGLHIDAKIQEVGNRIALFVASEVNSFVVPEQADGSSDPPVIRAISSQVDTVVVPGELTTVSSIDDVMSDSRYQLDVTVTKVE
jgi:hypothetical protein